MTPFVQAELPVVTAGDLMVKFGLSDADAEQQLRRIREQTVVMNDTYQVNITQGNNPFGIHGGKMVWLSIKRIDKEPIHDWRALQTIKNMLVGEECEGIEVYPAESRLVDTANQYHLWVFVNPEVRLPLGFKKREVMTPEQAESVGAKQRPFTS